MDEPRKSRERMNQERRSEVVAVAARLFARNGFHGTSMDDIARELGILKGSLYYWIDSKEALLTEVLAGATQQTIDEAEEIIERPLPAPEQLRLLIRSHIESWIRNPDNFNVFLSEYRWLDGSAAIQYTAERSRLEAVYKRLLQKGIQEGTFAAREIDVTIVVNLLFGAMNWFPRWYREDGWASPDYIASVLAELVINGLAHGVAARPD